MDDPATELLPLVKDRGSQVLVMIGGGGRCPLFSHSLSSAGLPEKAVGGLTLSEPSENPK